MQKEEYLIKNACYSVTKYYLCKRNNKRSLLGRKQRSQVARSFPNRYQFSCTNKVTSLFSISCILRIILQSKTTSFGMQSNRFCNALIINGLRDSYACEKYLQLFLSLSDYKTRNKREKKIAGKAFLCLKRFQYTMCFIIFLPLRRSIFNRNKEQAHRYEKRNRKSKNFLDSFSICL